ncbi:DUF3667 domain-containing protein [Lacibacter sp. H407]|uniref:DUF3667 domain-containing protein n=1 Tax=Lacibacter sp. H407 TaxID=3133423 RepID=UPI0030BBA61F
MNQPKLICKNCGNHFYGKYCNKCGEKVYGEHDKSIIHFLEEGVHFITHLEGTLFTTLRTIFSKPGKLSLDYCNGIRKKYFKPLSFFILLVIFYLFFPVFEGLNMKMEYYPKQDLYGAYAQQKIDQKSNELGITVSELSEKFHTKSEKASKFLLLVIIPFTALLFFGLAFFRRKYFFDHIVFAAEVNSVYLLWGFLLLPLLISTINLIAHWLSGIYISFYDRILGILIYGGLSIYLGIAVKRFYAFKWWQSLLFVIAFFFVHSFIVYSLYKFLLFVTVINQIH